MYMRYNLLWLDQILRDYLGHLSYLHRGALRCFYVSKLQAHIDFVLNNQYIQPYNYMHINFITNSIPKYLDWVICVDNAHYFRTIMMTRLYIGAELWS